MSGWLIGITAAAMLAAVARCLMPPGAVQQVGGLVCALMLLWAVLKPLAPLTGSLLREFDFTGQIQEQDAEWKQQSEQLLKSLIEQECATYIVDKAQQMGIICQAGVICKMGQDGVWLPDHVRVMGELTQPQCRELGRVISEDLGVGSDHQEYLGGG